VLIENDVRQLLCQFSERTSRRLTGSGRVFPGEPFRVLDGASLFDGFRIASLGFSKQIASIVSFLVVRVFLHFVHPNWNEPVVCVIQ
jgi:hypothetical protein